MDKKRTAIIYTVEYREGKPDGETPFRFFSVVYADSTVGLFLADSRFAEAGVDVPVVHINRVFVRGERSLKFRGRH